LERLALGRARASRARMRAVHARARVKLRVRRRFACCSAALAAVALGLGEPLGAFCLCCSVPRLTTSASERSSVRALSTPTVVNPACAPALRAAPRLRS
jgi:hypothetical protein